MGRRPKIRQTVPQPVEVAVEEAPELEPVVIPEAEIEAVEETPVEPEVVPEPVQVKVVPPKPVVVPPENKKPVVMSIPVFQPEAETPQSSAEFEAAYFEEMKRGGLDVAHKGAWQTMYAHYLNKIFGLAGKAVLDAGCAMGAISSALADYGAKVTGLDISHYALLNSPFKNFKMVNADLSGDLSQIPDNSIDFVHSMNVFHLISESRSLKVFENLNRICKNDALIFVVLPLGISKREGKENIQPKYFWDELAGKFGMKDGSRLYYPKLMAAQAPGWDFMRKYNWPFLLYKVCKGE